MNIGYLINLKWFPPSGGGTVHAYQIAKYLMAQGHQLHTIFYYSEIPDVRVYRQRELFSFLKNVDVLYIRIDGRLGYEMFSLWKILKLMKLPVVWEINSPIEELLSRGKSVQEVRRLHAQRVFLARFANACTCVSKEMREYAVKRLGIKDAHVVENGSDKEMFSPQKRDDTVYPQLKGKFKVVWAGSAHYKWQGTDLIMDTARKAAVLNKDIVFILITNKKDLDLTDGIPNNVLILDEKDYLQMPVYLASADAGICLYHPLEWTDQFYLSPLKLFDYMASGLPVIGTRIGQITDVIEQCKNGILVDNQVDKILESILYLKNNPDEARRMGQDSRNAVAGYYNWHRVGQQTEQVLLKYGQNGKR